MNESFVLRFKRGQQAWTVRAIKSTGVEFEETDAPARRLVLEFDTRSDVVAGRLARIRQLHGWRAWEFQLAPFVNAGGLGFRGVDPHALPPGPYRIKVHIDGLRSADRWLRVDIPQDRSDSVDVAVTVDNRQVRLELNEIDSEVARILAASSIDGAERGRWLSLPVRPTRQACLLNILALLRVTPSRTASLIRHVKSVTHVRDDRIYAEIEKPMYTTVRDLARDPAKLKFYEEGEPHAAVHYELLTALGLSRSSYSLESFRAEGSAKDPSLQAVFAVPRSGEGRYVAEFDIDLGNSLQDLEGFAIHIGELIDNKPTNHLDLRDKLNRAKDFLYYTVVNA